MANYANLINTINNAIKTNGEGLITGQLLQTILDGIVASLGANYQFAGVATTSTSPGTPDQNVFYIAGPGTYSNFGSTTREVPNGYIGVFEWNGSWAFATVQVGDANAVKYVEQTLTDAQKGQARTNIGAASTAELNQLGQELIVGPIDYTDSPSEAKTVSSAGKWASMSGLGKTVLLQITPGTRYRVQANLQRQTIISILAEENYPVSVGGNAVFASGYDSRITVDVGDNYAFTAPVDAKTLLFQISNSEGQNNSPTIYNKSISDTIDEIEQEIGRIEQDLTGEKARIDKIEPLVKRCLVTSSLVYVSETTIKLTSVRVIDTNGTDIVVYANQSHTEETIELVSTKYILVLTKDNEILQRGNINQLLGTDILLLAASSSGIMQGGALYAQYVKGRADAEASLQRNNVKKLVFTASLRKITENSIALTSLRVVEEDGTDNVVYADPVNHSEVIYSLGSGQRVLVLTGNNTITQRSNVGNVVSSDFVLLVSASTGVIVGGELFSLFNSETIEPQPTPSVTADELRNIHIALMNKYSERFGAKKSLFLAPNGVSYTTAKDMVMMCISAIENNTIVSFWGKEICTAPVFGLNKRLEVFESTYTDVISHPMVADLKNYYHIFGGKTGSDSIQGRNLVLACKSNVDNAWLVGCVMYATNDVLGDNRFSVMKDLFDLLETRRTGATVDTSSLNCESAYAVVITPYGNPINYYEPNELVYVAKNPELVKSTHSVAKLVTAIVAANEIDMYQLSEYTNDDDVYHGSSGTMLYVGDIMYNIDYMTTLLLTSCSRASMLLARRVGEKNNNVNDGEKLFSFGILDKPAYGKGTQTWLEWLDTPDYLEWSYKTNETLSCSDVNSPVLIGSGGPISNTVGGDNIIANKRYY